MYPCNHYPDRLFITLESSLLPCLVHNPPEVTTLLTSVIKDDFRMFLNIIYI